MNVSLPVTVVLSVAANVRVYASVTIGSVDVDVRVMVAAAKRLRGSAMLQKVERKRGRVSYYLVYKIVIDRICCC